MGVAKEALKSPQELPFHAVHECNPRLCCARQPCELATNAQSRHGALEIETDQRLAVPHAGERDKAAPGHRFKLLPHSIPPHTPIGRIHTVQRALVRRNHRLGREQAMLCGQDEPLVAVPLNPGPRCVFRSFVTGQSSST